MFRKFLAASPVAMTAVTFGGYLWARQNMGEDAVDRILTYDKVAVPAIIEYKYLEAKLEVWPKYLPSIFPVLPEAEQKRQFQLLHDKYAKPMFDVFMKLGGFYYKNGQKVAANIMGVVPKTYIDMFQPFLNDIPARPMSDIRNVINGELSEKGKTMDDIFTDFEEKPIGCASIGQVHRARLKSNNQRVVVKVQNPEAERTFRGDVFALKTLVDVFAPQYAVAFAEIERQFATEFDYRGECKNQMDVQRNLAKANFDVIVPNVVEELCSRKMMVMEEIYPATPLHDQLTAQVEQMAKQKGMTKEEFMEIEMEKMNKEIDALAKEGKVLKSVTEQQYDQYIALQKGKSGIYRIMKQAYNATFGWFTTNYDVNENNVIVPLNAARLINQLFAVHGHECLIDGCFNADPHPGNILCLDGKLALIDYGQVKRLSDSQRYELAKSILLVDAAIKNDPRQNPHVNPIVHQNARRSVINHAHVAGMNTKFNLDDTFYEMNVVYFGRMDKAFLYPLNVLQWTDKMQANDPMGDLPPSLDYLIMVNMTTMMLRGLGEYLQQYRNAATCWVPYARQALAEQPGALEAVDAEIASWYVVEHESDCE
jgi:hypothetical protein